MKRSYADTPEGQVHYQIDGSGDALLCLHQGPLSSNEYLKVMPILAKSYKVVAMDTLGYGKSDEAPAMFEMADYARSVVNFVKTLGINKTSIVGSKIGATIAVEVAAAYPEVVDKLILHGLPGFEPDVRQKCLNSWRYSTKFTELSEDGSHLLRIWEREKKWGIVASPEVWQIAVVDALTAGRNCYQGYQAIFRYQEESRLSLIKSPTLLVSGPKDIFRPFGERFQSLIPRCKLQLIEELEGLIIMMMPETFARVVLDFLANPGV